VIWTGCVTVTPATTDLAGSAAEVAVTLKTLTVAPAVKRNAEVIVPPVAVQVTAVLVEPETVAHCGVTATVTP